MLAHAGAADESIAVAMLIGAGWLGWIGWMRLRGRGFPRVPVAAAVVLLVTAAGVAVASAFVPRAVFGPTPATSTPGAPRIASTASLAIREPAQEETVTGDELRVVLDLEGAEVLDAATGPVTPATGHIHLSIDGTVVSMTYGEVQIVDLGGVMPGTHTLEASFVAADHLPFDPPVRVSVTFDRRLSP